MMKMIHTEWDTKVINYFGMYVTVPWWANWIAVDCENNLWVFRAKPVFDAGFWDFGRTGGKELIGQVVGVPRDPWLTLQPVKEAISSIVRIPEDYKHNAWWAVDARMIKGVWREGCRVHVTVEGSAYLDGTVYRSYTGKDEQDAMGKMSWIITEWEMRK